MKKIGMITFFNNYNYGSVLQCYALQQALRNLNVDAIVLNQVETGLRWKIKKIGRLCGLFISCIKYPNRWKLVYKSYIESKRSCATLSYKTRISFEKFIDKNIKYRNISFEQLKNTKDYDGFLSGSDQVWGTSGYFLNPFMFLGFADKDKRYSYAASFGTDQCPQWYMKKIKKYLSEYRYISVREESGYNFVKAMGYDTTVHIDPTMLFSDLFWRRKTKDRNNKYLFLYFLNEPSELAINHINNLIESKKFDTVIAAPYRFCNYKKINIEIESVELSPEEFLNTIDSAQMICTDSFHGAVFSMIFKKLFFSYYREYSHGMPQNNRIETLLKHFLLQSQLVREADNYSIPDYSSFELIIEEERKKSMTYLRKIIGELK